MTNTTNRKSIGNGITGFLAIFTLSLTLAGLILSMNSGFGATSSSVPSNVTVNSFVSLALSGNLSNGILFGSVDPNTLNNNASGNYNATYETQYWVYTGFDSNSNGDFCIRANESLRTGPGVIPTDTIGNGNFTFHNSTSNSATSPALACPTCGNMTTSNSRFATSVAPGSPRFLRFFLNITNGQTAGVYSNAVRVVVVSTGSSVTCSGA